jgi:hypothetical protein
MEQIISHSEIENTKAFKKLPDIKKEFSLKRANRKLLSEALVIFKTTGKIIQGINGYNSEIFKELILTI